MIYTINSRCPSHPGPLLLSPHCHWSPQKRARKRNWPGTAEGSDLRSHCLATSVDHWHCTYWTALQDTAVYTRHTAKYRNSYLSVPQRTHTAVQGRAGGPSKTASSRCSMRVCMGVHLRAMRRWHLNQRCLWYVCCMHALCTTSCEM